MTCCDRPSCGSKQPTLPLKGEWKIIPSFLLITDSLFRDIRYDEDVLINRCVYRRLPVVQISISTIIIIALICIIIGMVVGVSLVRP